MGLAMGLAGGCAYLGFAAVQLVGRPLMAVRRPLVAVPRPSDARMGVLDNYDAALAAVYALGMEANLADPTKASHLQIDLDEEGQPVLARFTYVDEETCIGCKNCALGASRCDARRDFGGEPSPPRPPAPSALPRAPPRRSRAVARSTFMIEDGLGKARVYSQGGDSEDRIAEAIDSCPVTAPPTRPPRRRHHRRHPQLTLPPAPSHQVNCIHYVCHEDLVVLENERLQREVTCATSSSCPWCPLRARPRAV